MTKEEARVIRGKEICFLRFYFYPFLDKAFPNIDVSTTRRVAMAIATLCNCSAKAVEEMIQLKNISFRENEDIQWKTEHNIYPHRETHRERIYCMYGAKCPVSKYRRNQYLGILHNPKHKNEYSVQEPTYMGKAYYWGPILHEEHWEAIEKIMITMDKILTTFPTEGWWTYDSKIVDMVLKEDK